MSIGNHFRAITNESRQRISRWILGHRIRARHPTLVCHPTVIWDYGYDDIDSIQIGVGASVLANANILVHRRSHRSRIDGQFILGDGAVVSVGVTILAAGGVIRIGNNSGVAPHCVVVAANHLYERDGSHLHGAWNEKRVGVELDDNVFVGSLSVLLPGTRIGKGSVIVAGSLVSRVVPPGELWGGWPARKLTAL